MLIDAGTEWWLLQRRRDRVSRAAMAAAATSAFGPGIESTAEYVMPLALRLSLSGPGALRGAVPRDRLRCHSVWRRKATVRGIEVEYRLDAHTERGLSWFADAFLTPHDRPDGAARKAKFTADVRHLVCATTTAEAATFVAAVLDELASFVADLASDGFAPAARELKLPLVAEGLWFDGVGDIAWDVSLPTTGTDYRYIAVAAPTAVRS